MTDVIEFTPPVGSSGQRLRGGVLLPDSMRGLARPAPGRSEITTPLETTPLEERSVMIALGESLPPEPRPLRGIVAERSDVYRRATLPPQPHDLARASSILAIDEPAIPTVILRHPVSPPRRRIGLGWLLSGAFLLGGGIAALAAVAWLLGS